MNQLTKTLLFALFIISYWAFPEELVPPDVFLGGFAVFILSGLLGDLVKTLRARRAERDRYKIEAPDPGSIRRYLSTAKTCPEEFATFEGYE